MPGGVIRCQGLLGRQWALQRPLAVLAAAQDRRKRLKQKVYTSSHHSMLVKAPGCTTKALTEQLKDM